MASSVLQLPVRASVLPTLNTHTMPQVLLRAGRGKDARRGCACKELKIYKQEKSQPSIMKYNVVW